MKRNDHDQENTHDDILDDPQLTGYALGEIEDADEIARIERLLEEHDEARRFVDDVRATGEMLASEFRAEPSPALSTEEASAMADEAVAVASSGTDVDDEYGEHDHEPIPEPIPFASRLGRSRIFKLSAGLAAAAMVTIVATVALRNGVDSEDGGTSRLSDTFAIGDKALEMRRPSPSAEAERAQRRVREAMPRERGAESGGDQSGGRECERAHAAPADGEATRTDERSATASNEKPDTKDEAAVRTPGDQATGQAAGMADFPAPHESEGDSADNDLARRRIRAIRAAAVKQEAWNFLEDAARLREEGEFALAKDLVAQSEDLLERSRGALSEEEYKALRQKATQEGRSVENEWREARLAEARSEQESIRRARVERQDRLEVDRQRRIREKITEIRRARKQGDYEQMRQEVDALLFLDPDNPAAEALRDVTHDQRMYAEFEAERGDQPHRVTPADTLKSDLPEGEQRNGAQFGGIPIIGESFDLRDAFGRIEKGGSESEEDRLLSKIPIPNSEASSGSGASIQDFFAARIIDLSATDSPDRPMSRFEMERRQSLQCTANEEYARIHDNEFKAVDEAPLSTFSIDVDTASYTNVRRFINEMSMIPPADAVRIEELINNFEYDYEPPAKESEHPFAVHAEVASCPWNDNHRLARIGLKGYEVDPDDRPPTNLVFLIDSSGSMRPANKLPLIQRSLTEMVENLTVDDRIAIVTYAGNSRLVLDSTAVFDREKIIEGVNSLSAGGSTNGEGGLELAYDIATKHFIEGGTNRVILCTDGDFNVGTSDNAGLTRLIEEKRETGVFLSVLGFGMGNLKDDNLELLADKGNGHYAYIDNYDEAHRTLVERLPGTLITIAKDVKMQLEFNPESVSSYRLIGYENRVLAAQDFNDDTKDAGEIGAGHTVTALYEIVPAGAEVVEQDDVDPLVYQETKPSERARQSGELFNLKLRYKQPDEATSTMWEIPVADDARPIGEASSDFQFASGVAAYGMILRQSPYRGGITYGRLLDLVGGGLSGTGGEVRPERAEFLRLVRRTREISPQLFNRAKTIEINAEPSAEDEDAADNGDNANAESSDTDSKD